MMWPYFDLVTDHTPEEVAMLAAKVKSGAAHPMDIKMSLAEEIIAGFHGAEAAAKAAAEFQRIFRDREAPEEILKITVKQMVSGRFSSCQQNGDIILTKLLSVSSTGIEKWTRLLSELEQVSSASEAERIMKGRGFEVDGKIISDPSARVDLNQHATYRLRIGKKKFLQIIVE
jgi:tyrosyl-tRNA synthetase